MYGADLDGTLLFPKLGMPGGDNDSTLEAGALMHRLAEMVGDGATEYNQKRSCTSEGEILQIAFPFSTVSTLGTPQIL